MSIGIGVVCPSPSGVRGPADPRLERSHTGNQRFMPKSGQRRRDVTVGRRPPVTSNAGAFTELPEIREFPRKTRTSRQIVPRNPIPSRIVATVWYRRVVTLAVTHRHSDDENAPCRGSPHQRGAEVGLATMRYAEAR